GGIRLDNNESRNDALEDAKQKFLHESKWAGAKDFIEHLDFLKGKKTAPGEAYGSLRIFDKMKIFNKANESMAMSKLKEYQVSESLYKTQSNDGSYAAFNELLKGGELSASLSKAWNGQANPEPLNGYLFSDILQGDDGSALDRRSR